MPTSPTHKPILDWYGAHARDLPWRGVNVDGWQVLVSEVMLQQTPVVRVQPVYEAWMERWPTPGALALERSGEAVRMWGRLGYPRRALRLHQAAVTIEATHDGIVPASYDELRTLPGIGDYTAAAVVAFAYRQRTLVLDTNVRRVLGRFLSASEFPAATLSRAERAAAESVLPDDPELAAAWSVAVMELGAMVCTARTPGCVACPISGMCAWRGAGYPAYDGPPRRGQTYAGTDRQVRGLILAVLREAEGWVSRRDVLVVCDDARQRDRALASLIDDGLVVEPAPDTLSLP